MSIDLIEKMGNLVHTFDGRNMSMASLAMCIKKSESMLEFYDKDGNKSQTHEIPTLWRFIWKHAPMGSGLFAMHVSDVYDIEDTEYYYVKITLTDGIILSEYKDQLVNPELNQWEEKLLPWKKFKHYSYKEVRRGAP